MKRHPEFGRESKLVLLESVTKCTTPSAPWSHPVIDYLLCDPEWIFCRLVVKPATWRAFHLLDYLIRDLRGRVPLTIYR